jgi:hypothetical protein
MQRREKEELATELANGVGVGPVWISIPKASSVIATRPKLGQGYHLFWACEPSPAPSPFIEERRRQARTDGIITAVRVAVALIPHGLMPQPVASCVCAPRRPAKAGLRVSC